MEYKNIEDTDISNKKVFLRADLNVSIIDSDGISISDDARIRHSLPTIKHLLKRGNKLILTSHLGRPINGGRDYKLSLKPVVDYIQKLIPQYKFTLVDDFTTKKGKAIIEAQEANEVMVLENIRFYKQEKLNNPEFSRQLADLADVYVNDAFGVSHRVHASVVGIAALLPSYMGLLLKKEIEMISKSVKNSKSPVVAIIGGTKISTKLNVMYKFMEVADNILVGGGLANTFFPAQGIKIGKSICEYDEIENAKQLMFLAAQNNTAIHLPSDVVVGHPDGKNNIQVKKVEDVPESGYILDIGPETQAKFGNIISNANTIIWNGPIGLYEKEEYKRGTDFIYYSIAQNSQAMSIVGGGDTLAAISKKEYLDKITHISTGGGAMLEFIEKGTLPGIEILR